MINKGEIRKTQTSSQVYLFLISERKESFVLTNYFFLISIPPPPRIHIFIFITCILCYRNRVNAEFEVGMIVVHILNFYCNKGS